MVVVATWHDGRATWRDGRESSTMVVVEDRGLFMMPKLSVGKCRRSIWD
jgi:hypothetical protein